MFFAYFFAFSYCVGSVWATYAIIQGCIKGDEEFLKGNLFGGTLK
jgi:hypothetical protein